MASFTRTIPKEKQKGTVRQILATLDHYIPLTFQPKRGEPGDYIYLVYRGEIVGRAKISSIDEIESQNPAGKGGYPSWARWVVRYSGGWEAPPYPILVEGHQGVRYLETLGLGHLDTEGW